MTRFANPCWYGTGQTYGDTMTSGQSTQQLSLPLTCGSADSRVRTCPPSDDKPGSPAQNPDCGTRGSILSASAALRRSLRKTSFRAGGRGCPQCGAICINADMPACAFECEPVTWDSGTNAPEGSWWPTLLANDARTSKRSRGHGMALREFLRARGLDLTVEWCEEYMGFPPGWTDTGRRGRKGARIRALGNAVVPACAEVVGRVLGW